VDAYRLTQAAKTVTLTLMTPCAPQVSSAGEITLPMPSGAPVHVAFDGRVFQAGVEEIKIEDDLLRRSWGDRLFRILLRADAPPLQAKWALRITQ
jgi:hypothetical protein